MCLHSNERIVFLRELGCIFYDVVQKKKQEVRVTENVLHLKKRLLSGAMEERGSVEKGLKETLSVAKKKDQTLETNTKMNSVIYSRYFVTTINDTLFGCSLLYGIVKNSLNVCKLLNSNTSFSKLQTRGDNWWRFVPLNRNDLLDIGLLACSNNIHKNRVCTDIRRVKSRYRNFSLILEQRLRWEWFAEMKFTWNDFFPSEDGSSFFVRFVQDFCEGNVDAVCFFFPPLDVVSRSSLDVHTKNEIVNNMKLLAVSKS